MIGNIGVFYFLSLLKYFLLNRNRLEIIHENTGKKHEQDICR